jgi:hypothetical protein
MLKKGTKYMKCTQTSLIKSKTLAAVSGVLLSSISLLGQSFSGNYEIVSACSGMVLDVQGSQTTNGTPVDQYVGNGDANQQWTLSSLSGAPEGPYKIINVNSGRALEVLDQSMDDGATVDQWDWWGGANSNQQWLIVATGTVSGIAPVYEIFNVNSGLALDVAGQGVGDGTVIDQWSPTGQPNQQWLVLPVNGQGGQPAPTPDPGGLGDLASNFHGFNWADPRDNFQDGPLVLDGMSSFALLSDSDNYPTVQGLTDIVLAGFGTEANTIRIPINPATVIGGWWQSYKAVIDETTSQGRKVILATWSRKLNNVATGKVDDQVTFYQMWDIVVQTYNGNGNVYFEILNEPYGYSQFDWGSVVVYWLARYSTVPHGRVLVGGTGYDENVPAVGNVPPDCLFSVHDYGSWHQDQTTDTWFSQHLAGEVGSYIDRCVLTEFGAAMTGGPDYSLGDQGSWDAASMIGFCTYCRNNNMGSVYWNGVGGGGQPGAFSMFTFNANRTGLDPENPSGLSLVQFGWGF